MKNNYFLIFLILISITRLQASENQNHSNPIHRSSVMGSSTDVISELVRERKKLLDMIRHYVGDSLVNKSDTLSLTIPTPLDKGLKSYTILLENISNDVSALTNFFGSFEEQKTLLSVLDFDIDLDVRSLISKNSTELKSTDIMINAIIGMFLFSILLNKHETLFSFSNYKQFLKASNLYLNSLPMDLINASCDL
jgi:hypothetical protein